MPGVDTYTKTLLHMNGTNNGTTFTDDETSAKTFTAVGDAKTVTSTKIFGTASGYFDGSGDKLTTPDSTDFSFGTGNFTIDVWANFSYATGYRVFCGQFGGGGGEDRWYMGLWNTTILKMFFNVGGTAKGNYSCAYTAPIGEWHHYAFVRNATAGYIFVDGVAQSLTTTTGFSTNDTGNVSGVFNVADDGNDNNFYGYLDEFRVSKGIARWTSNFTPPTAEYDANAAVVGGNMSLNSKFWGT